MEHRQSRLTAIAIAPYTLAGLLGLGCADSTGVAEVPSFTADQAESVIRFLSEKMPLYHSRLAEAALGPDSIPYMTITSLPHRLCDPDYVAPPSTEEGWGRGVIAPELVHGASDDIYKVGYLLSPGLVVIRASNQDTVIVEYGKSDHYCQFSDEFGFKIMPRVHDRDGGFDLFHPGMLQHTATYDGQNWRGEWTGFFQPVLDTGLRIELPGECEVRLLGEGAVAWEADRAVVPYSGKVCGYNVSLDIDVTSGGRSKCTGSHPTRPARCDES